MEHVDWTEDGLRVAGFRGFIALTNISADMIPGEPGVYVVVRTTLEPPKFSASSPAGHPKGKEPTVSHSALHAAWVTNASVVYIGKAGAGRTGRRGLRRRLVEYQQHGRGEPVGHWGGRYIWQLVDHASLLVAWRTTAGEDPASLEASLIKQFAVAYGARPFANRKLGTSAATA